MQRKRTMISLSNNVKVHGFNIEKAINCVRIPLTNALDEYSSYSETLRSICTAIETLDSKLLCILRQEGPRSKNVGSVLNQIGNIYFRQGNLDSAALIYRMAIKCESSDHLAASYFNLGTVHWRTGNIPEAIRLLRISLLVQHKTGIPSDVDSGRSKAIALTASTYHQLGLCFSLLGELDNAIASMKICLKIRIHLYGRENVEVVKTYEAIAKVYNLANNMKQSSNSIDEAKEAREIMMSSTKDDVFHQGEPQKSECLENANNIHERYPTAPHGVPTVSETLQTIPESRKG